MFKLSDSDHGAGGGRTRTITIAYADAPCLSDTTLETIDENYESSSTSSLATPSTLGSALSVLDRLDQDKEKERFFGYHPIWREMSLSEGIKLKTLEYLWECRTFQLFNFLMTHLLAHTPEDHVSFLVSLIERCIRYRDEDGDPPLVFEDSHIYSVYVALDPLVEGSISYRQYLNGMQTLGLTEFNILPNDMDENQNVAKDVFLQEAKSALLRQLDLILGKGRSTIRSDEMENVVEYEKSNMVTK